MEKQDLRLRQNDHHALSLYNLFHGSFNAVGLVWGLVLPTGAPPCKLSSSSDKIPSDRRPQWCALPHPIPCHPPLLQDKHTHSSLVLISCFESPTIQGLLLLYCSEEVLFFFSNIFIYSTAQVLVAVCEIFSCSMWDLVPPLGIRPRPPALEIQSLSLWTTREAPVAQKRSWLFIYVQDLSGGKEYILFLILKVMG